MSDASLLLGLQEADLELMRLQKQLDALPEKALILECRRRRTDACKKQAQVVDMADEVEASMDECAADDAALKERIAQLQARLDEEGDFRRIENLTREMQSLVKRREKVEFKLSQLAERSERVDQAKEQIKQVLDKLQEQEESLTKSYQQQGSGIMKSISDYQARRDSLSSQMSASVLERYTKLVKTKAGIAAAKLDGRICSACRVELQEGQLQRVRSQAPIATCPICNRMLVVGEE